MTERIPYSFTSQVSVGDREEIVERHESFGLISFSRLSHSGHNRMFGSHLDDHPTTYQLTVRRAQRVHSDLAYDRFRSDHDAERIELITLELTATQFVDLLTSLNMGEGIPCTLRQVMGTTMEDVPVEHQTERILIRNQFGKAMRDIVGSTRPFTDKIKSILGKATIGKGDRKEILTLLDRVLKIFGDSAPFALSQFNESADRMEKAGKAEVEAYAHQVIVAAGLEHLRKRSISESYQNNEIKEISPAKTNC